MCLRSWLRPLSYTSWVSKHLSLPCVDSVCIRITANIYYWVLCARCSAQDSTCKVFFNLNRTQWGCHFKDEKTKARRSEKLAPRPHSCPWTAEPEPIPSLICWRTWVGNYHTVLPPSQSPWKQPRELIGWECAACYWLQMQVQNRPLVAEPNR